MQIDALFLAFTWHLLILIVLVMLVIGQAAGLLALPWWAFVSLFFVGAGPFTVFFGRALSAL